VQQQAEGVGSEAVAAQAVSGKTILEFFNAVLTFPAIVVTGKDGMAAAFSVGDEKAQVGSGFGVFGLVTDAPLMRPAASAIEKAGKGALRLAGATLTRASKLECMSKFPINIHEVVMVRRTDRAGRTERCASQFREDCQGTEDFPS
jgi:hypothetical protein